MVIVTLAGGPAVARALALRNGRNERTFASPFAQRRRESSQRRAVQLVELTPQHLRIEVRRVTSGCAFRWFERFPEKALDVVSLESPGILKAIVLRTYAAETRARYKCVCWKWNLEQPWPWHFGTRCTHSAQRV